MDEWSLDFVDGLPFLLILALLSTVAVAYLYRNLYPPQSGLRRKTLKMLRLVVLLGVSAILAELAFGWISVHDRKPSVALLLDVSRSMSVSGGSSGFEELRMAFDAFGEKLSEVADVDRFAFAGGLESFSDVALRGHLRETTDISGALRAILKRDDGVDYGSVYLFTDGQSNAGESVQGMARRYTLPVNVVGYGSEEQQRDVQISTVSTGEIGFVGDSLRVEVAVESNGFEGERTIVRLRASGLQTQEQIVILGDEGFRRDLVFSLTPLTEGELTVSAEALPMEDEFTSENNRRSALIRILPDKRKVLLLAGSPNPDFAFLRRLMKDDDEILLRSFVQKSGGGWYEEGFDEAVGEDYDLLILVGFPARSATGAEIGAVVRQVRDNGASLLYVDAPGVDARKVREFAGLLPVSLGREPFSGGYREVSVSVTEDGLPHPFTRALDVLGGRMSLWDQMPPIYTRQNVGVSSAGSKILLKGSTSVHRARGNYPLLVVSERGRIKSAALMVFDMYLWDMLPKGVGDESNLWRNTLIQGVKWLASREDLKRVRIRNDKPVYARGERVKFRASLYDESYKRLKDAKIEMYVRLDTTDAERQLVNLRSDRQGVLIGEFLPRRDGKYIFTATGTRDGYTIGEDTGSFFVERYSVEYRGAGRNSRLLRELTALTGGDYIPFENFNPDSLIFTGERVKEITRARIDPGMSMMLLLLLIILLAVEWSLRKIGGML